MPLSLKDTAEKIGVSTPTLKRWLAEFGEFMIDPDEPPKPGKSHVLNDHNIQALYLVSTLRDTGYSLDQITERLTEMRRDGWRDLPELPKDWFELGDLDAPSGLILALAERNTSISILQQENSILKSDLEKARTQVIRLETDLKHLETDLSATKEQKHAADVDLERARASVARLESQLSEYVPRADLTRLEGQLASYSLWGDKPINVGLLILGSALAAVVIILLVFVVARLVM